MPNWVSNQVTITAPRAVLDDVRATVATDGDERCGAQPFSFDKLIPIPADQHDNWYEWNVANWGTKWEACESEVEDDDDALTYTFNTAWSPPIPVFEQLARRFPDATLSIFYEEEQGWGGRMTFTGGTCTDHDQWDVPTTHREKVAITGYCWCDDQHEPVYPDCYTEQAKALPGITDEQLTAIGALTFEWSGTFDELVEAAGYLTADQPATPAT